MWRFSLYLNALLWEKIVHLEMFAIVFTATMAEVWKSIANIVYEKWEGKNLVIVGENAAKKYNKICFLVFLHKISLS